MSLDLEGLSHKKVAGVPVVYAGAVLAAGGLYWAIKSKSTPAPSDGATAADSAGAGDTTGNTNQPDFVANNVPTVSGVGSSVTSATTQDTNDAWIRRAVEWLVQNGTPVGEASAALTAYVNGDPLSTDQGALRDKAVQQFGLPPETVPVNGQSAPPRYNGPASSQGTPPLTHTVKGKSDNSAQELARLYYGLSNADSVRLIAAANPSLVEPYAVGAQVTVPKFHAPKFYKTTAATHSLYDVARKNGTTPAAISALNPGLQWPVKIGTRVRVK